MKKKGCFEYNGKKYKTIVLGYCEDCAFLREDKTTSCYWLRAENKIPQCNPSMRADDLDVIFVEIKNND